MPATTIVGAPAMPRHGAVDPRNPATAVVDPVRSDPARLTGKGWVAEEALATALLCFLGSPRHPLRALTRAATADGDSDSIAALTGALCGAHHGMSAWPRDWIERIEYRHRLDALATALSGRVGWRA